MPLGSFRLNGISKIITAEGKTVRILGSGSVVPYGRIGTSYQNQGGRSWLEIDAHPDFAFGTSQNFTMEGWFWHGSDIDNKYFWDGRDDSNSVAVLMDGPSLKAYIAGAYRISGSSGALRPNTWHHVAYTRNGTTGTLWWNGTSVGTWTDTVDYTHANSIKVLSRYVYGQGSANSYVDEFRISKVARYTTSFTPTTTGFSSDADTLLLLHLDSSGTQARTPKTVTAVGDARTSNGTSKFGGKSARFDGTGDRLNVTGMPSTIGDFTIECWVNHGTISTVHNNIVTSYVSNFQSDGNWAFRTRLSSTTGVSFTYRGNTWYDFQTNFSTADNQWHHIAAVHDSVADTLKIFVDGTERGSWSFPFGGIGIVSNTVYVGGRIDGADSNEAFFNGYIDELRISDSVRYTGNFTPQTTQFESDSNTLLLLHMDGFGNQFYDEVNSTLAIDSTGSAYSSPGAGNTPLYPTTTSVRTTVSGTASTITVPATAQPGDLLVLADMSTTVSSVVPSGWTNWASTSTTGIISNVSAKICNQADIGATITGMAGTTRKVLIVYQGNYEMVSTYRSGSLGAQATTATPNTQTISMSGQATPLIAIAVYAKTTSTTPTRGWTGGTPAEYSSVSTSGIYVKTLSYNVGSSPANATITMSDAGTNILQSFFVQVY
jgi:hypothetical protein